MNVAHGHEPAEYGSHSPSSARATAPMKPPPKIAASSRGSARTQRTAVVSQAAARSRSIARSRSLRVIAAARSNSARASAEAAELLQQVAAHAGDQVVVRERRLVAQRVDELEPGGRPERHPQRDGAVELDHGRAACAGRARRRARRSAPSRRPPPSSRARGRRRSPPAARTARRAGRGAARARARRARGRSAAGPSAPGPGRAAAPAPRAGPTRARSRDACSSISATSPWTSGSSGMSSATMRPSRSASWQSSGRIQSSPAVAA